MKHAAAALAASLSLFGLSALGTGLARAQTLPDISSYLNNIASSVSQPVGTPSPVDLLFESDSYVPPFYKGRALPSPGSTLHFQAIAHFTRQDGSSVQETAIIYTWRREGRVEGSLSGAGRSSIFLPAPTLFGRDTISVNATTADGSVYGSASVTLASLDPQITLYQDHPLFGIEYFNALSDQTSVSDVEMSFAAIPYFVAAAGTSDPRLSFAWSVNGTAIPATTSISNEITVNAANSNGQAAIALSVTSSNNPLLDAQHSWTMTFSRSGLGASAQ